MPRLKTTRRKELLPELTEEFPASALFAAEYAKGMGRL
jgi:hypothetical protein